VEYQPLCPGWYRSLVVVSMMEVEYQDSETDGQRTERHCARQIDHCGHNTASPTSYYSHCSTAEMNIYRFVGTRSDEKCMIESRFKEVILER